jgi:hypothetical protein
MRYCIRERPAGRTLVVPRNTLEGAREYAERLAARGTSAAIIEVIEATHVGARVVGELACATLRWLPPPRALRLQRPPSMPKGSPLP